MNNLLERAWRCCYGLLACLLALVGMLRLDGPVASLNIARSSGFDDELTEPQLLSAGAGFDEYQPPSSRCAQRAAATRTHTQHTQREPHPLSPVRACVCASEIYAVPELQSGKPPVGILMRRMRTLIRPTQTVTSDITRYE